MKKSLILLLILFFLTGCSTQNVHKQADASATAPVSTATKLEQETTTQGSVTQPPAASQQPISASNQSTVDKNWFAGSIGNSKIHAKFDISGKTISGIYYYDKHKTNIKLDGSFGYFSELKDYKTISVTEDTDKKGEIIGIFRNDDYIEGCWKKDNVFYPMYLIREGSDITPPKKPGTDTMKFNGHWTGKNTGFFGGSEADIKVLFDDLIYYALDAFNGTHSGVLDSFGIVKNNAAISVFKDTTNDEKNENVIFEFIIQNNLLKLNSNQYHHYCGAGVGFDSSFVRGEIDVPMPTALEVGIVDTKEQADLFKKLVGDKYDEFISYTSYVNYSEVTLDGEKVKAGNSYLRGAYGYCSYIISQKHIYAAILGDEEIYYYTNDKNYAKKIPEPMAEWAQKRDKIIYNYKE